MGRFDILKYSEVSLNRFSVLLLLNILAALLDISAVAAAGSVSNKYPTHSYHI